MDKCHYMGKYGCVIHNTVCCGGGSCGDYISESEFCKNGESKVFTMEGNTKPDMINRPPHYTQGGIECIDAIKAAVEGRSPYEAWLTGQIIKYIWRYPFKNHLEDLEKAKFYLDRLLQEVKMHEPVRE